MRINVGSTSQKNPALLTDSHQVVAAADALVAVGVASGGVDDVFRHGREAAARRTWAAAAHALTVVRGVGISQGHAGYGGAQAGPEQGVGAVTGGSGLVVSRTRPREGEASPAREQGPSAGRGTRGLETRERKANRVSVDPRRTMAADLDERGDEEDMQGQLEDMPDGPSQQALALMLGGMGM